MANGTKAIAISKLVPHPDNPNVMSDATFRKLVRNIERTGLYEPIVVRRHPKRKGQFEIINGHHRVKALKQLGKEVADCVVWDVDDEQTGVLLATLNRLCGSDVPLKKIELLKQLRQRFGSLELSKILPRTAKQIDRLCDLKLTGVIKKADAEQFAIPLVFFVTKQQQEIVEKAIAEISPQLYVGGSYKQTKAQRRAAAIAKIAEHFLERPQQDKSEE